MENEPGMEQLFELLQSDPEVWSSFVKLHRRLAAVATGAIGVGFLVGFIVGYVIH